MLVVSLAALPFSGIFDLKFRILTSTSHIIPDFTTCFALRIFSFMPQSYLSQAFSNFITLISSCFIFFKSIDLYLLHTSYNTHFPLWLEKVKLQIAFLPCLFPVLALPKAPILVVGGKKNAFVFTFLNKYKNNMIDITCSCIKVSSLKYFFLLVWPFPSFSLEKDNTIKGGCFWWVKTWYVIK